MVYTARFAGGRGGRNGLEHELRRLGVRQKNGRPNHPQTQGKIEDLHIRIIDAATGELLRSLTLDPNRNYQPTGKPRRARGPRPKRANPEP